MHTFLFVPSDCESIKAMRHSSLRRVLHWCVRRDLTEGTVNEKRIENEAGGGGGLQNEDREAVFHRAQPSVSVASDEANEIRGTHRQRV